jgi:transketolase
MSLHFFILQKMKQLVLNKMLNKDLRKKIVEKSHSCKLSHCGGALSCVDFINYLYENVMKENDLFILSKGHGSMALYGVLEKHGKNPAWTMHPELNEKQGIYATTGSLGHGLPIAVGRALAKKLKKDNGKVYVLCGDCEMAEGSVWEALSIAKTLNVDNLTVFVDCNKYGVICPTKRLGLDKDSLKKKLEAFGFNSLILNGHDENELGKIKKLGQGLNAIVLDTIKGKGIDFLEKSHAHGFNFFYEPEKYERMMKELE